MTTSPNAGSNLRTGRSLPGERRRWIAIAVGLVIVVVGIVFILPKGDPDLPDDLCSVIGKDTLALYVPNPTMEPSGIEGHSAECEAVSAEFKLRIDFSRGESSDESHTKLCQGLRSRDEENTAKEDMIKPSETAEFGDRMCGTVFSSKPPLESSFHAWVLQGDIHLDITYDGGTGSRSYEMRRGLNLTRAILAKVQ